MLKNEQTYTIIDHSKLKFYVFVLFCFMFSLRLLIILWQPMSDKYYSDKSYDISEFFHGGQLINHGINPYNWNDNPQERYKLHMESFPNDPMIPTSQEQWNFQTSANLPLTLIFDAALDKLFPNNPFIFRIAFAIADSLAGVFIFLYIIRYWEIVPNFKNKLFILGLCCPLIFLYEGTVWGEDKGVQILLMLMAIYYSRSSNKMIRLYLSPIFLGMSVAFKAIGIFIAPICLYYVFIEKNNAKTKNVLNYLMISLSIVLISLTPFFPDEFTMIKVRLSKGLSCSEGPFSASMWRIFCELTPTLWLQIKLFFSLFFMGLILYGFVRRIFSLEIITASLLLLFVVVLLIDGGMDRYNMAVLTSLVIMGHKNLTYVFWLGWYYILGGAFLFFT